MARKTKTEKPQREPDKIWPICMNCWFVWFKDKFGSDPTFIGAAASCYKKIVGIIKKKTTDAGFEWNEITARENLTAFFESAYNHTDHRFKERIHQEFTTPNLLYHIDKILLFNGKQGHSNSFQKFARIVNAAQERIPDFNCDPRREGVRK